MMLQLVAITTARQQFVTGIVPQLESSHPDVVEEMLASSTQISPIGSDGVCRSNMSGSTQWAPRVSTAQLTEAFATALLGSRTAAAASIAGVDTLLTVSQPYCVELPAAMLELIQAEPNGEIGKAYQRYIRASCVDARSAPCGGDLATTRGHDRSDTYSDISSLLV